MNIIKHGKIYILISSILVGLSLVALIIFGIPKSIEFTGGSMVTGSYEKDISITEIETILANAGFQQYTVQTLGEKQIGIKLAPLSDEMHTALLAALMSVPNNQFVEVSHTTIGPSIGKELTSKALIAGIVVSLSILFFVAYAFRSSTKVISSWKFGLVAIATLIHDIALTTGVYVILSHVTHAELDALFVVAILTVLGLSVNDTIVVFDRVRENIKENEILEIDESLDVVVGESIEQTKMRSFNTSFAVVIVLLALVVLGPQSTKIFSFTLMCGMIFGTYSSIFLASPLLVFWNSQRKHSSL